MKILFLLSIDMNSNGPSVHLLNDIINSAKEEGFKIDIIQKKYIDINQWENSVIYDDVNRIFEINCRKPQGLKFSKRFFDDVRYARECYKIYKKEKYDLIFLQSCNNAGYHVKYIKRNHSCPIIYNVQDIFPLDIVYEGVVGKKNPIYLYFDLWQKYAYKYSEKIITISNDMKDTLVDLKVPTNKIEVIFNWEYLNNSISNNDISLFREEYLNKSKYSVVYAGNIGLAQDVENVLKAANLLKDNKDICFYVIGQGSRKKQCLEYVNREQLENVFFLDLLPQEKSKCIYKGATINIVTLKKGIIHTSLPSKTATCFNSNRPFIYCVEQDSKIIKTLDNNTLFFRCNPEEPKELAGTIVKILDNVQSMNFNNEIVFSDFVDRSGSKYYINIFKDVLYNEH